jgi:DNA repair photolyase
MAKKRISGTKEWAASNVNCVSGCSHDCLYCYARANAVRYKQKTVETWPEMVVRPEAVAKGYGMRKGRIMFPTAHDITPDVYDACYRVLLNMLAAGNDVLVVSKPHEDVITKLCAPSSAMHRFHGQLLFRFTIGAMSKRITELWEPGAPDFWERYRALTFAHNAGFATSVSMEPLLEPERVEELVEAFTPVVSDAIWIGKMNKSMVRIPAEKKTDAVKKEIERIGAWQSDERVKTIYSHFKDHPLIKWKESYKEVVGIKLAEKAGEDV